MDFGVLSLDGLMGSDAGFSSLASDPETKQKWYGARFLKQERSAGTFDDDWRSSKSAKDWWFLCLPTSSNGVK